MNNRYKLEVVLFPTFARHAGRYPTPQTYPNSGFQTRYSAFSPSSPSSFRVPRRSKYPGTLAELRGRAFLKEIKPPPVGVEVLMEKQALTGHAAGPGSEVCPGR